MLAFTHGPPTVEFHFHMHLVRELNATVTFDLDYFFSVLPVTSGAVRLTANARSQREAMCLILESS